MCESAFSFVMFGRPPLTTYISAAPTGQIFVKFEIGDFLRISVEIISVWLKIEQIFGALNMNNRACFGLLAATCLVQPFIRHIAALPRLNCQYLLQCLQRYMSVNNTKGTHFCLSMATVVTRTRRSVTFYGARLVLPSLLPNFFLVIVIFSL
jgi:hypothetical protein